MDRFEEAKDYMSKREIPQLFESLMTGLMYNKPQDHLQFLEDCLTRAKEGDKIKWNSFLGPLPPIPQEDKPIQSENVQKNENAPEKGNHESDTSGLSREQQPLPPIRKSPPLTEESQEHSSTVELGTTSVDLAESDDTNQQSKTTAAILYSEAKEKNFDDNNNNHGDEEQKIESLEQGDTNASPNVCLSSVIEREEDVAGEKGIAQPVVFVLGGPGSGKGTQCAKIADSYGFLHLSAGDLLRAEMNNPEGSESAALIAECIKGGTLVPQEITIQLLQNAIMKNRDAKGFLIDGFPREIEQGLEFEEKVCKSAAVLMFTCDDNVMVERLLERGKTSGRTDDNEDTIKLRLKTFHEKTVPVTEYFKDKVTKVDASLGVEEIYKDVKKFMDTLLDFDELSQQIDSLMAEMEKNPIRHEDEEEENEQRETLNAYPQIEDEIVPKDAPINGDKGNVDMNSEWSENQQSFEAEKSLERSSVFEEYDEANAETKLAKEDVIAPVDALMDGDLGNVKVLADGRKIICVIGPQDSTLSEQCALLAEKIGFHHININKQETQTEPESALSNGSIERNPINELKGAMFAVDPSKSGFVIEGFPESVKEGESLEQEIGPCDLLVLLDSPIEKEIQDQAAQPTSEGSSSSEERTLSLQRDRESVAIHYDNQGRLATISTSGSREEVFERLRQVVQNRVLEETTTMSKELENANIIFVLGGPGSGKGTQCAKIVEKYGFCHLSTGDLLREEVNSGSERAKKLKDIMEKGELVSQEVILELLKDAMIKRKDCKGFLIDGFPRDVPQGDLFEKTVGTCKFVLYFDCSNEVMVERLLGRAKTSGRVDDNEETIKKRLKTFENQTLPVLDKYGPQDKVRKINAERGVDDIFADVCSAIDKM